MNEKSRTTLGRILLLDDELAIVFALKAIFEMAGFEVAGVCTHDEAVAAAREFRPDIFVTGVFNCCQANGCETAVEIRKFLPQCSVLVLTGTGYKIWEEHRKRGYDFDLLLKPQGSHVLIEKLKSYVSRVAPEKTQA